MERALGEFEQLVLLAVLDLEDEAYGASIGRSIEERTGREVSAGAVYTALDRLGSRGFVTSRMGEPAGVRGGRRKKYYRLQPEGALALRRSMEVIRSMAQGLLPKLENIVGGAE